MTRNLEATIQRLVDRQLDPTERSELLLAADRQPELWRVIALRFVEEQVWQSAIPAALAATSGSDESSRAPGWKQRSENAAWGATPLGGVLLAVAATIVIGVTIALSNGLGMFGGADEPDLADRTDAGAQLAVNDEPWVLDIGPVEVPVYQHPSQLDQLLGNQRGEVSPAILNAYRQAGYDLQPVTRYIEGQSPDGRRFQVPVRDLKVHQTVQ